MMPIVRATAATAPANMDRPGASRVCAAARARCASQNGPRQGGPTAPLPTHSPTCGELQLKLYYGADRRRVLLDQMNARPIVCFVSLSQGQARARRIGVSQATGHDQRAVGRWRLTIVRSPQIDAGSPVAGAR